MATEQFEKAQKIKKSRCNQNKQCEEMNKEYFKYQMRLKMKEAQNEKDNQQKADSPLNCNVYSRISCQLSHKKELQRSSCGIHRRRRRGKVCRINNHSIAVYILRRRTAPERIPRR